MKEESLMIENILITGGAGYIGSHVLKQLLETTKHNITVVDNLSTGTIDSIKILKEIRDFDFFDEDLKNSTALKKIFQEKHFTTILHFAGSILPTESLVSPLKYYLNNTAITISLVNLAVECKVKKFIFSSTAAVYGDNQNRPVKEEDLKNPITPYGKSKLMIEEILQDTHYANKEFKYVILRYFNVAGAEEKCRIGQGKNNSTHLIKTASKAALGTVKELNIFGNNYNTKDGTCIRDFIHVEDLASAHLKSIDYLENNEGGIFNVGYGKGYSVQEVVETMKKISSVNFPVVIEKRREGDLESVISDNRKIIEKMQWTPKYFDLDFICQTSLNWEKKQL